MLRILILSIVMLSSTSVHAFGWGDVFGFFGYENKSVSSARTQEQVKTGTRNAICSVEKNKGLPIRLDPELKQEMIDKMGKQRAAQLVTPVVRANVAHICYCGTLAERQRLGCPNSR